LAASTKTVSRRSTSHKTRLETVEELETESPKLSVPVDPGRDHVHGPVTAPLTLVEYGDYQCPFCGAAYPEVKKVQKELGQKLRFVFRNFPLTRIHPYAESAAETAEAASAQGKFWEMHDFLYEHQNTLNDPKIAFEFARKLGLNTERFQRELSKHAHLPRIKEDFTGGIRSGVNGTPTFYVNGVRHDADPTAKEILRALEK
jgi:protein-disulfide isomerase